MITDLRATAHQSPAIEQLQSCLSADGPAGPRLVSHRGARVGFPHDQGSTGIMEIQPKGTRPPLFLVHGAGGGMLWGYKALSHHLGTDQPVLAFLAPDENRRDGFASIEEMAARYVVKLRLFQPQGPYFLGGYCFGGNVAYEMGRQLHAQGHEIALLALINSVPPNSSYERIRFGPEFCARFLKNVGYWSHYLLQLKSDQRWDFLSWKLRAIKRKLPHTVTSRTTAVSFNIEDFVDLSAQPEGQRRRWEAHIHALFRHHPGPYVGKVTLFRTHGHPLLCSFDAACGWGDFAGKVSVRIVSGAHGSVLNEPHVRALAGQLKRCLQEAPDDAFEARSTAVEAPSCWKKQLADVAPARTLQKRQPASRRSRSPAEC
ncbi:MAG TPA: thioesterase domain-containing protein [Candidatus Acidoferrum sp.]|jgi:thioesterase domain-containing protein|nr:thioesterase domain-containing protein [Candidatus Acidoferrum sp.]